MSFTVEERGHNGRSDDDEEEMRDSSSSVTDNVYLASSGISIDSASSCVCWGWRRIDRRRVLLVPIRNSARLRPRWSPWRLRWSNVT